MKFRGIFAVLVATLVVAVAAVNANAAKLVYTQALQNGPLDANHNPNVPVGTTLYTIAVQLFPEDGSPDVLGVSLTFGKAGGVAPIQTNVTKFPGRNAIDVLQSLQDNIDGGGVNQTGIDQGTYADSWIYGSGGGQLLTDIGDGPVPAAGNPQLNGPNLSPNPHALVWQPQGSGFTSTNVTGAAMSVAGVWGNPISIVPGDPIIGWSQVGAGIYPLVQILVPTNGSVPIPNGVSNGISFKGQFFDVLGGLNTNGTSAAAAYISGNPLAYLTDANAIPLVSAVPEPSTIALAGLGLVGVFFARRRRK